MIGGPIGRHHDSCRGGENAAADRGRLLRERLKSDQIVGTIDKAQQPKKR